MQGKNIEEKNINSIKKRLDKIANESELLMMEINGAYTFRRDNIGKELRKIEDILRDYIDELEYAKIIGEKKWKRKVKKKWLNL